MDDKLFNDLIASVTQAGIIRKDDTGKPRIILKDGIMDGCVYNISPLEGYDQTPRETYSCIQYGLDGGEKECSYTYSHKIKGTEDYVYKAKE